MVCSCVRSALTIGVFPNRDLLGAEALALDGGVAEGAGDAIEAGGREGGKVAIGVAMGMYVGGGGGVTYGRCDGHNLPPRLLILL